jgi:hypothetical protein
MALTEIEQLQKKALYGGIEIGAKGVKGMVLALSPAEAKGYYHAFSKYALVERVGQLTGETMNIIEVKDEVFLTIVGAIPEQHQNSSLSLDIGSGNTKIGYIEYRPSWKRALS